MSAMVRIATLVLHDEVWESRLRETSLSVYVNVDTTPRVRPIPAIAILKLLKATAEIDSAR